MSLRDSTAASDAEPRPEGAGAGAATDDERPLLELVGRVAATIAGTAAFGTIPGCWAFVVVVPILLWDHLVAARRPVTDPCRMAMRPD